MTITEYIFSDCHTIKQSAISDEDLLHKYHGYYQKKIYEYLIDRYLGDLKAWWVTYKLPFVSETDRCIFLYEPRCHENLEFVIYNLTYFARGWGLIIYCSKDNYNYIMDILKHNRFRAIVHIIRENQGGIEVRREYNNFIISADFWNSLPCKYVLMGEMDVYLRKALPAGVLNYDYVCAEWPWDPNSPGGSGLSIRKVEAMKRICDELPTLCAEIPDQDAWVSTGCSRLKMSYNNGYFVEGDHVNNDPVGFHNWWTFITPERVVYNNIKYEKYLTLELT